MDALKISLSAIITLLWCEIILLGNGKWSEVYLGVNVRKILFGIMLIMLLLYFTKLKTNKNYILLCSIPLIAWLIWGLFIPAFNSAPISSSLREGAVLFGFAIMPVIVSFFLNNKSTWLITKKWIIFALALNSLFHLILIFSVANILPSSDKLIDLFIIFLNPYGDSSLNINSSDNELRVGWISSSFIFMLFGAAFLNNYSKIKIILFLSLAFAALIASGLRGFFFAFLYAGALTLFVKMIIQSKIKILMRLNFVFLVGVCISVAIIFFGSNPDLLEHFGVSRVGSDSVRYEQSKVLMNEIEGNIIVGKGLGATVSYFYRPEEAPYAFEQYILSLVMKTGAIGVLFFSFYSIMWLRVFQKRKISNFSKQEISKYLALFFMLNAIFAASSSNPYLFNFVGLFYIYFICVEHAILHESSPISNHFISQQILQLPRKK